MDEMFIFRCWADLVKSYLAGTNIKNSTGFNTGFNTFLPESVLTNLDPFYAVILRSYSMLNKIFYDQNKKNEIGWTLPQNLWLYDSSWNTDLCNAGYLCVSDLPVVNGKIDFEQIQKKVHTNSAFTGSERYLHVSSVTKCMLLRIA